MAGISEFLKNWMILNWSGSQPAKLSLGVHPIDWEAPTEMNAAGMLIWDPSETSAHPGWYEVDAAWLDGEAAYWREEKIDSCASAAARASGALRLADAEKAVILPCGVTADDFEEVALSINPDAVIENIDGDDVVVMPTMEAHAAFTAWCAEHVSWD